MLKGRAFDLFVSFIQSCKKNLIGSVVIYVKQFNQVVNRLIGLDIYSFVGWCLLVVIGSN
jgi:hypothetical protein